MNKNKFLLLIGLFIVKTSVAQVTDPMIINWWFNTTNHTYNGVLTDVEAVYYNTQNVYVKSADIPHYYTTGYNVNNANGQNDVWVLPRTPQTTTNHMGPMGGQTGVMMDGSVFFTPGDAQSYNNAGVWNRLAYYFETDMDPANGHSTPTNMYHHHFDNLKLHNWDSTKHSPIVAYAFDGNPVYGPYGYANTNGTGAIVRIKSSYQKNTYTTRTNGPNVNTQYPIGCFIEDWTYTASSGDLDQYNGRFCITPEYPAGTYAYFTTVDAMLKPCYPYFIGPTFYGAVSNVNMGPTGGSSTVATGATQYVPAAPTTAIDEIKSIEDNISMYPTPVTDNLYIKLNENKNYTVVLYDEKGAMIQQKVITGSDSIQMSQLPYGMYFIEVTNNSDKRGFIKRIVKQ